jgi:hypothetical protein
MGSEDGVVSYSYGGGSRGGGSVNGTVSIVVVEEVPVDRRADGQVHLKHVHKHMH